MSLRPRGRFDNGFFASQVLTFGHLSIILAIDYEKLDQSIDIESLKNRLLKVCYVPATSAGLPRVSFFFSFLFLMVRPLTVLMKQTRQAVRTVRQSILLDVYGPIIHY